MATENPGLRLSIVGIVAISLFAALFVRMYTLQVVQRSDFQQVATSNHLRVVHEEAPRGRILDRNQNVLVDSHEVFQVIADIRELPTAEAQPEERARVLTLLAQQLTTPDNPVTVAWLEHELAHNVTDTFAPVPVMTDISEDTMVALMERQEDLPGISVRRTTVRQYPYGSLAAHVLGYTQSINQARLDQINEDTDGENPRGYLAGDHIGTSGIEAAYEDELRGTPGQTTYVVDASGNIVSTLAAGTTAPVPGHDILTTLDVNIQALAESELKARMDVVAQSHPTAGGSVVVLDPNTGGVVAMASYPTFNPNDFVQGISQADYSALTSDDGPKALLNRATSGDYAPGSTFKPVTAVAGFANGVRSPTEFVNDTGEYHAQGCTGDTCIFHNDEGTVHGAVDLRLSLEVSSDFYYYGIGDVLWLRRDQVGDEALQDTARAFGFGDHSGIEIPGEHPGVVPTPERMAQNYEDNPDLFDHGDWRSGDNIHLAIGQGDLIVTPLQLADAYAAIATGGTIWRPHLATDVVNPTEGGVAVEHHYEPALLGRVNLPPEVRNPMIDGLVGVTSRQDGTAYSAFENNPAGWLVAGKTGTAQVTNKESTSVFAGFGPVTPDQPPQYVAVALLEEAGYGGDVAAPLVARIFAGIADPTQMPVAPRAADVLGDSSGSPTSTVPAGG